MSCCLFFVSARCSLLLVVCCLSLFVVCSPMFVVLRLSLFVLRCEVFWSLLCVACCFLVVVRGLSLVDGCV